MNNQKLKSVRDLKGYSECQVPSLISRIAVALGVVLVFIALGSVDSIVDFMYE